MNITRLHISVFLALTVASWAGVLFLQGETLALSYLAPYGAVVGILAGSLFLVEHVIWKWSFMHGWFIDKPNIKGTWKVTLQSDWVNPATGEVIPPIECYMGVEQTLSSLQMHLMTPESESWFVAHSIRKSPSESGYQVVGVYTNKPNIHLRNGPSNMHLGALVLDTHGLKASTPQSMTGEYWTDRKTTGRLVLDRKVSAIYTRFDDARQAISSVDGKESVAG
jgi:hypothetical protein